MLYWDILSKVLMKFEGFSAVPYWDSKQWSWGYGSKVPNSSDTAKLPPPKGLTISKLTAAGHMLAHVQKDEAYLKKLIKVELNAHQWAALLSFSYNTGAGAADNLVPEINAKDDAALFANMRLYNKGIVKGKRVVMQNLVNRREAEIKLWQTK